MSLDTADVAQHVREILSSNNIGQRLFARHVLGLSQGTVSELLSKPKHWDKLTEKGRDSYRRMHQWIRDGGNVAALKAYAPKKGTGSGGTLRRSFFIVLYFLIRLGHILKMTHQGAARNRYGR